MSCSRRLVAALALLAPLALGACGNLPRPFQPDDKSVENPLLVMPDRAGVVVAPVAGLPEEAGERFAERLAAALRAENVTAHTALGTRESPTLLGYLAPAPGGGTRLVLPILGPDGALLASYETAVDPRIFAPGGAQRPLDQLAGAAAAALAARFQPDAKAQADAPPVFIGAVAGPPAEAGRALERALDYALRRAKVVVAEAPGARTLTVAGRVGFAELPKDMVALDVDWRVLAADGTEVGSLKQQNDVPAAVLARAWAEIASAIAENAAEGIAEIVNRARRPAR